jgi:hypothetical protein
VVAGRFREERVAVVGNTGTLGDEAEHEGPTVADADLARWRAGDVDEEADFGVAELHDRE